MHVKKSWYTLVTLVMLVAMLAGCAPVAPAATAPAAGGEAAAGEMPFAGTELRLVGANHPWQVAITPLLAEFEAATGIKVNFEAYGEDQLNQKLTTEFTAGGSDIDVFMQRPLQEARVMLMNGLVRRPRPPASPTPDYRLCRLCRGRGRDDDGRRRAHRRADRDRAGSALLSQGLCSKRPASPCRRRSTS
jgi:hypothetical protein